MQWTAWCWTRCKTVWPVNKQPVHGWKAMKIVGKQLGYQEPSVELSNFRPVMLFVDIHKSIQVLEGSFLGFTMFYAYPPLLAATTHTVDNRTKTLNEYASCTCKIKDQRAIASTRKHLCISLQCRTHTESLEYSYKIMTSLPNVLKVFICQSQTIQILNIVCDQGWIPVPTDCESGFGLYDEVSEEFVAERARSREAASTCRACLPGTHSKLLGRHVATCGVSDFWVPINKREPKGNDQRTDTGTHTLYYPVLDCSN